MVVQHFRILATRISQLEQKFLYNDRIADDTTGPSTLSPSAILLNGYSPATVDQEIRRSSIESDLADLRRRLAEIDVDDDDANKINNAKANTQPLTTAVDDSLEQNSNESIASERSIFDDGSGEEPTASDASITSYKTNFETDINIDLEDLPADVVDVIRQALVGSEAKEIDDDAVMESDNIDGIAE